ncbi:aminomethyltransferase family protein [Halobellus rufus]|uniref:aminomethyltransferase family protein n=1 Tax=Halobellus rufus TaxID=1448860 RepID=UPI0018CDC488|nr:aminomethyltransferase family protein [Halobellus rufus]
MVNETLEDALANAGSPTELLRQNRGRHPYPVPSEHTNWIEEVRSWRETCSLSDLSHHQKDLYVEGPEALDVFADLGVNNFEGFEPGQAKQFVACNPNGNLIGDAILFYLEEDELKLTGTPVAPNWVEYNLERGDYDVRTHVDDRYHDKDEPHDTFRYQLQGPNALDVMRAAVEGSIPEIPFFNFDEVTIGGVDVRALKHSMASNVGFEIWGPWEEHETVRDALVDAGEAFGLRQLGEKSYKAQGQEKGWIARPLPAIFGEEMAEYREWLDADSYEAISTLGGSFDPDDVSEYYLNPIELGYERFVDFEHDFVGKEALREMAAEPQRRKVTLVWDDATCSNCSRHCSATERPTSTSTSRCRTGRCSTTTRCGATARPSVSRSTSGTRTTNGRCSRWRSSTRSTPNPGRKSRSCGESPTASRRTRRSNRTCRRRSQRPSHRTPTWRRAGEPVSTRLGSSQRE